MAKKGTGKRVGQAKGRAARVGTGKRVINARYLRDMRQLVREFVEIATHGFGWSVASYARRADLSPQTIKKLLDKTTETPQHYTLEKMARAIDHQLTECHRDAMDDINSIRREWAQHQLTELQAAREEDERAAAAAFD